MTTQNLVQGGEAGRWDQAIYAFLAEKERRSGSMRTVRAYSGMLYRFFGTLGKSPDQVTATEIFGYTTLLEDWFGLDANPIVNGNFEKLDWLKK